MSSQDDRDPLLRRMTDYITEAQKHRGDPRQARIMGRGALADPDALVRAIGNSGQDLDARGMLGYFFWTRFQLGGSVADLRRSATHFDPLYDNAVSAIPEKAREFIAEVETRMDRADELTERGPCRLPRR